MRIPDGVVDLYGNIIDTRLPGHGELKRLELPEWTADGASAGYTHGTGRGCGGDGMTKDGTGWGYGCGSAVDAECKVRYACNPKIAHQA